MQLADGLVQGSSIMPQKRNPVALEHARSITSKALGEAAAIVTAVHNTPFGDIVDTEDDLQPLVASMFRDGQRAVALVAISIRGTELDVEKLGSRAEEGGTTMTELADRLVRDHNISFSKAHAMAAGFLSGDATAISSKYTEEELARIISARNFVEVRRIPGGPAPSETMRALGVSRELIHRDRAWLDGAQQKIEDAAVMRRQRAHAL
jgi:argininosuccinate lyase